MVLPTLGSLAHSTVNASTIKGNISNEEKELGAKMFAHFVSTSDKSYGAQIGQRLKPVEMNILRGENEHSTYGETVFEILVEKDMCNVYGTLHGACAAYIVDPCSVSSLVILGNAIGYDGTGVSQSLNLIWHQPVHLGAKLRIVSTSISIHGHVRTARCELWAYDKLCVSAVHSTINPWAKERSNLRSNSKLKPLKSSL